jgi:P27 family predicted phage terminase small subunit
MGSRGPLPKSPALRIAGRAGSAAAKPTAAFVPGIPVRPKWLAGEARAEWDRIVPDLDAAGQLAVTDRAALVAYCLAWAELVWATTKVEEEGRLVEEPQQTAKGELLGSKLKAHPAVRLQRDAFHRVKVFLVEFGLSPAARRRVGGSSAAAETQTGQPGNPFAAIAGRVAAARSAGPAAG